MTNPPLKIVEKAIYEMLKTLAGGKVYGLVAAQNTAAPYIIYQRAGGTRWRAINNPSGVAQVTIQIDAYAATYFASKELAAQIEQILDGFAGVVEYGTASPKESVEITGISLQNDVDIPDQFDKPFLYRGFAQYLVTYIQ